MAGCLIASLSERLMTCTSISARRATAMPPRAWPLGDCSMMVVCPARPEARMVLRTDTFAGAVSALGTPEYGRACFRVFEQSFDVDHWALFRYQVSQPVKCIATASRTFEAVAEKNVGLFLSRCYRVDPSLIAFREQHTERPCLIKMGIADIDDVQYRHCFEVTDVRERLSFFAADRNNLLQLCIYRTGSYRTFSGAEMNLFATLARLVIATALKHEEVWESAATAHGRLDLDSLERRLGDLAMGLSEREKQVCARAVAGRTIEETAADLGIRKTSVITYRQRAYQKLGISKQSDLLALVCDVKPAPEARFDRPSAFSSRVQ
jgi:DNA-binding CsgD family transcriptional regulator